MVNKRKKAGGHIYRSITIGSQTWLFENLRTTHYRNGDTIANVTDSTQWCIIQSGAYCDYGNQPANVETYGRLYNWYAVTDSRNIAPEGYHVAGYSEWQDLKIFLGAGDDVGAMLKETGTAHWISPNNATNASGFTALPSGLRNDNGSYVNLGLYCNFWNTQQAGVSQAYGFSLSFSETVFAENVFFKRNGLAVRCIKD